MASLIKQNKQNQNQTKRIPHSAAVAQVGRAESSDSDLETATFGIKDIMP